MGVPGEGGRGERGLGRRGVSVPTGKGSRERERIGEKGSGCSKRRGEGRERIGEKGSECSRREGRRGCRAYPLSSIRDES